MNSTTPASQFETSMTIASSPALLSDHTIVPTGLRTRIGRRRLYFISGPTVNEYLAVGLEHESAMVDPALATMQLTEARKIAARVNDGVANVAPLDDSRYTVQSESGLFEYIVDVRAGERPTFGCTCNPGALPCWHKASVEVFIAKQRAKLTK